MKHRRQFISESSPGWFLRTDPTTSDIFLVSCCASYFWFPAQCSVSFHVKHDEPLRAQLGCGVGVAILGLQIH